MKVSRVSWQDSRQWNDLVQAYLKGEEGLRKLYNTTPSMESMEELLDSNRLEPEKRKDLVQALTNQYQSISTEEASGLIKRLAKPNTFTVTTGHQLCLMGGPAYFFYKIAHCIRLASDLRKAYPDHDFIPIYWMATEDHDFAEINHFVAKGEQVSWSREEGGAVGRMQMDGIESVRDKLDKLTGGDDSSLAELFEECYAGSKNLSEATMKFVHRIFGYKLLCLDADSQMLKKHFEDVMLDDMLHQTAFGLVKQSIEGVKSLGYKNQVNPREVNLFYLEEGYRERIVADGNHFKTTDARYSWEEEDLKSEVASNPERFSPNVILRPVYQECILPNIAYIGGGAELAYWLLLKPVFDHYDLPYPTLIPRVSFTLLSPQAIKKRDQLGLDDKDLFRGYPELEKHISMGDGDHNLFEEERRSIERMEEKVKGKMEKEDPTLLASAEAQFKGIYKAFDKLDQKVYRARKVKNRIALDRLDALMQEVKPGGKLQERVLGFERGADQFGIEWVGQLPEHIDPFGFDMIVLKS